jgi:ribonuclease HI
MQIVLRKVGGYLRSRLLTVAASKNQAIVFQKSSNQAEPWMTLKKLRINGSIFEWTKVVKFLGIKMASSLTGEAQVEYTGKRVRVRLRQLASIASRSWGASMVELRAAYIAYILSVITYAGAAWWASCAETHRAKLRTLHHAGARIITGCVMSTDINSLLLEADIKPLDYYFELATAIEMEKWRRMPEWTTMYKVVMGSRKISAKKEYWQDLGERILREADIQILPPRKTERPIPRPDLIGRDVKTSGIKGYPRSRTPLWSLVPPWSTEFVPKVTINSKLERPPETEDPAQTQRDKKLVSMDALETYGAEYLRIYTDGSVDGSLPYQGAGAYLICDGNVAMTADNAVEVAANTMCYSMRAEALAILAGVRAAGSRHQARKILVATDSASTLDALLAGPLSQKHEILGEIWKELHDQLTRRENPKEAIAFQFIYSHCEIAGNDAVDRKAGLYQTALTRGTAKEPKHSPPRRDIEGVRLVLKERLCKKWKEQMEADNESRSDADKRTFPRFALEQGGTKASKAKELQDMTRKEAVLVRQLRVGETPLMGLFYARLSRFKSMQCRWCRHLHGGNTPIETVQHLFDVCLDPGVAVLRIPELPIALLDSASLFADPHRAIAFYKACIRLLPPPLPPQPPPPPPAPPPPGGRGAGRGRGGRRGRGQNPPPERGGLLRWLIPQPPV